MTHRRRQPATPPVPMPTTMLEIATEASSLRQEIERRILALQIEHARYVEMIRTLDRIFGGEVIAVRIDGDD